MPQSLAWNVWEGYLNEVIRCMEHILRITIHISYRHLQSTLYLEESINPWKNIQQILLHVIWEEGWEHMGQKQERIHTAHSYELEYLKTFINCLERIHFIENL